MDIINSGFQFFACFFIWFSIASVFKNKSSLGVSKWHIGYFFAYGVFMIFYYLSLDQYFSLVTNVLVVISNAIYLGGVIKYEA